MKNNPTNKAVKDSFHTVLGTPSVIKIVSFMIKKKNTDHSMSDIAKKSGVGWTSFNRVWHVLEHHKIVKHTRKVGRAKLYKLNKKNIFVEKLIQLHDAYKSIRPNTST